MSDARISRVASNQPSTTPLVRAWRPAIVPSEIAPVPRQTITNRSVIPQPEAMAETPAGPGVPAWLRLRMAHLVEVWARDLPQSVDGHTSSIRLPPLPSPEQVAHCEQRLQGMPVGYTVQRRSQERRERVRLLRVIAGRTTPAPAQLHWKEQRAAEQWSQEMAQATARGWAHLALARDAVAQQGRGTALGYLGACAPTTAGAMLGSTFGTQQGRSEAVIDCLEQAYLALRPQRGVVMPWMHWVGAYGGKPVSEDQLGHDAMLVMQGMGLDPQQHLWALFGHDTHWHLIASRVRDDGRTYACRWAAAALRVTVDVLDAESGRRTGYRAVGPRQSCVARNIRQDRLCAQLMGRDEAGRSTIEDIPLQGPSWAARLATLGTCPDRVCGLMVIPKPSYRHTDAIVRHCIDA